MSKELKPEPKKKIKAFRNKKLNKHDLIKFTNAGWSIEDLLEYTGMSKNALLAFMKGYDIKVKKAVVPKGFLYKKNIVANEDAIEEPMRFSRFILIFGSIIISVICMIVALCSFF